ncbi:MAG TPA: Rab family GTPase [Thermoanaerobaculia bacterium]|nr:Rab family GTPase [Thermoanaerobaculia bacterium]
MIQKKVCMLGAYAVGKTSLVSRFVRSLFSDKYHSTVGVKVDKKVVAVGEEQINLLLWDLYGEDDFQKMRTSYLRGSSGYVLVVDGTRRETLERAVVLQSRAREAVGPVPFVLMLNKADLVEKWEVEDTAVEALVKQGWSAFRTSAKTGDGVEQAFLTLARKMTDST